MTANYVQNLTLKFKQFHKHILFYYRNYTVEEKSPLTAGDDIHIIWISIQHYSKQTCDCEYAKSAGTYMAQDLWDCNVSIYDFSFIGR